MTIEAHLPSPGDVVAGKYRIERLLGRGGMGAVFAAHHELLHQRVALKLLLGELADHGEATARFLNEARAAARIQGEHVARVLDVGQLASGAPYMILEYLDGVDLAQLLRLRGPLPFPEVADYALQALDAIAQAHAAGIVHRDLKPANLFLARRHDGSSHVKVLDFGISKNLAPDDGALQMTSTRSFLGSPEYMSPEQLRYPRGVDARTDIWSLGIILYELLTGRPPFFGETIPSLFIAILQTPPAPIRATRPDVPPAFEEVIARCLQQEPSARFASARELFAALLPFASDHTRALAAVRGRPSAVHPTLRMSTPGASFPPQARTTSTPPAWSSTDAPPAHSRRARIAGLVGVGFLFFLIGLIGAATLMKRALRADPADEIAGAASAQSLAGRPPETSPDAGICSPNYFFDKHGTRRTKPECF